MRLPKIGQSYAARLRLDSEAAPCACPVSQCPMVRTILRGSMRFNELVASEEAATAARELPPFAILNL